MPSVNRKLVILKDELIRYHQGGFYKKIEKLYPRYKHKTISDIDIWKLFANAHAKRSNYEEVVHCCQAILEIEPGDYLTAFNMGAALENLGRNADAIIQYNRCIEINPEFTNAHASCARLHYVTGDPEAAIRYYNSAPKLLEDTDARIRYCESLMAIGELKKALHHLGIVLQTQDYNPKAIFLSAQCHYQSKDYAKSEELYLALLDRDKNNINAINNLGRLYEESGRPEMAIDWYKKAIKIDNSIALLHRNLGKALVKCGDIKSAKKEFQISLEIEPDHPETYFNLGKLYSELHEVEKAKNCLSIALEKDIPAHMDKPDEFVLATKYFLSSLENPDTFDRDKKAFIADLFDGYAEKFDRHLVDDLEYRTPDLIGGMLEKYIENNRNNSLDLGCGTGLCCEHLRQFSNHITGVDLSSKMIDKARSLRCYDNLVVGEITETVQELSGMFDLIIAADVFVYIGSLKDIFHECSKTLTDHGYFIFSTESLPKNISDDYRLYDSGRYKHSIDYIDALATEFYFSVEEHVQCILRLENGKEVYGIVSVLSKSTQH